MAIRLYGLAILYSPWSPERERRRYQRGASASTAPVPSSTGKGAGCRRSGADVTIRQDAEAATKVVYILARHVVARASWGACSRRWRALGTEEKYEGCDPGIRHGRTCGVREAALRVHDLVEVVGARVELRGAEPERGGAAPGEGSSVEHSWWKALRSSGRAHPAPTTAEGRYWRPYAICTAPSQARAAPRSSRQLENPPMPLCSPISGCRGVLHADRSRSAGWLWCSPGGGARIRASRPDPAEGNLHTTLYWVISIWPSRRSGGATDGNRASSSGTRTSSMTAGACSQGSVPARRRSAPAIGPPLGEPIALPVSHEPDTSGTKSALPHGGPESQTPDGKRELHAVDRFLVTLLTWPLLDDMATRSVRDRAPTRRPS